MTDDEFEVLVYTATQSADQAKTARTISKSYTHAINGLTHAICALAEALRTFARAVTPPEEK